MRSSLHQSFRSVGVPATRTVVRPWLAHHRHISSTPARRADSSPSPSSPVESKANDIGKQKQTDATKVTTQDDELPLLRRPLGVREKPQAKTKLWKEDLKEKFLDRDKQLAERHHLAREATRGYFSDLVATRKHGGKTWIAPKVMIREDKALYFPDILGTPLVGNEKVHTTSLLAGKVSIVTILTTRISEIQTAQFVQPTHDSFASNPMYQRVQINLQDNLVKSFLVTLFASSIRKTVPKELWPTYIVSSQNTEYLREPLGIANRHVGYVFLVDPNLKIRWAACADPKAEEIAALRTCTSILLDRTAKEQPSSHSTTTQPAQQEQKTT
ncbi:ATP10 protein-domain-containing protein [Trametes elegans]|nr:ATP10 protein-domain-containing protein [Trametes elegans]